MVQCGTIQVGSTFDPANVGISDCSVSVSSVSPGGTVPVDVTVENTNDVRALFDVQVSVGGETTTETAFSVAANGSTSLTVKATAPTTPNPGYDVNANLTNVREFEGD